MTAYGAFVELEEGIDGMIHVSDMSWTRKINHPSEVLKKNDEVEAVVIDIDKTNQRISLGIKQLSDDPWKEIDSKYKIGDLVKGKVTKLASFGAFVQLQDDIDGLVHISQLSEDHVDKVKDVLKVGQEVEARVIKVDKVERRIGLSIKAANYSEEELKRESEAFDSLRPGEDMVGLEKAFEAAAEDYRPGERERRSRRARHLALDASTASIPCGGSGRSAGSRAKLLELHPPSRCGNLGAALFEVLFQPGECLVFVAEARSTPQPDAGRSPRAACNLLLKFLQVSRAPRRVCPPPHKHNPGH